MHVCLAQGTLAARCAGATIGTRLAGMPPPQADHTAAAAATAAKRRSCIALRSQAENGTRTVRTSVLRGTVELAVEHHQGTDRISAVGTTGKVVQHGFNVGSVDREDRPLAVAAAVVGGPVERAGVREDAAERICAVAVSVEAVNDLLAAERIHQINGAFSFGSAVRRRSVEQ